MFKKYSMETPQNKTVLLIKFRSITTTYHIVGFTKNNQSYLSKTASLAHILI